MTTDPWEAHEAFLRSPLRFGGIYLAAKVHAGEMTRYTLEELAIHGCRRGLAGLEVLDMGIITHPQIAKYVRGY